MIFYWKESVNLPSNMYEIQLHFPLSNNKNSTQHKLNDFTKKIAWIYDIFCVEEIGNFHSEWNEKNSYF